MKFGFLKGKINRDNISIVIAVSLIIMAILGLTWHYFGDNISGAVTSSSEDPRDRAAQIAYKEFKKLGEKDIKKEELDVIEINRTGQESYYVSSKENSIQIRKETFDIMRINNVKFEE